MIRPERLKPGDRVAALSLSSGLAGEPGIRWRYEQGKRQLQDLGFEVVEARHTLSSFAFLYEHPQKRAEDLHEALQDPSVKAIIACIGGEESYRLLPYLDETIIRKHPKIFIGYSDSTSIHMLFNKAGIVSYYGPNILVDFAENGGVYPFTWSVFQAVLMHEDGVLYPWRKQWTSEHLEWDVENRDLKRTLHEDRGPFVLQGRGIVQGRLIGGCLEVLAMLRGTELYPELSSFSNSILFLETSEEYMPPHLFERELRTMAVIGVFKACNGVIFGKPQDEKYYDAYLAAIRKVVAEFHLETLPIVCNCNFGHTEPKWTLPLGVMAELNVDEPSLRLLEASVV